MLPRAVFLATFTALLVGVNAAVTNEDIRVAILQIVNVVRTTEDKLERHEYRNKAVGEQLKHALINIDRKIKLLDPLKGTVSRLDERLAAVETILMQKDEKEKNQLKKTYETVVDIQKNLPLVIEQLKNEIIDKISSSEPPAQITEPTVSKKDFDKLENEVLSKMDKIVSKINNMEGELVKIGNENKNIKDINNNSTENMDKVKRQLDSSEQLLARYENKLAEYNNKIPEILTPNNKEQDEWKQNFLQALDEQKLQVRQILEDVKVIQGKVEKLPQKTDLELTENTTLSKLEEIKVENLQIPDLTLNLMQRPLDNLKENIDDKHNETQRNIGELSDITTGLTESFSSNYEKIRLEIQNLGRLEQVMMLTADGVLDTKRRVEYGVHQIIEELGLKIKESTKSINQGINDRFDSFELSILDEESGALANLTSKIGEEIDQVWRQIGIMHQQMTLSSDTLNKLQNQTDAYVNGSLNVMDSMTGKVSQITGRMTEVDENLNYLLGRLSLVTQEFNQIKTGLGKALDEIRGSFIAVEDKLKKQGPGPHKINSNEVVPTA